MVKIVFVLEHQIVSSFWEQMPSVFQQDFDFTEILMPIPAPFAGDIYEADNVLPSVRVVVPVDLDGRDRTIDLNSIPTESKKPNLLTKLRKLL